MYYIALSFQIIRFTFSWSSVPLVKLSSVHYESSSSSSSSEEEEEESDKEEEEPKKCTRTNCKNNCKICTMKKINDNMKAQPEYEVIYNNKLLRSHQTNILKVCYNMKFLLFLINGF